MLEVAGGALLSQPLLERAVEALELAERLRVGGGGVDQLDVELAKLALEGDLVPEEAPGEAHVVVGEELPRQSVGGGCVR